MKRILVLLTMALVMAAIMVAMAMPAFARWETSGPSEGCRTGHLLILATTADDARAADAVNGKRSGDMFVCQYQGANGNYVVYDNRPLPG